MNIFNSLKNIWKRLKDIWNIQENMNKAMHLNDQSKIGLLRILVVEEKLNSLEKMLKKIERKGCK